MVEFKPLSTKPIRCKVTDDDESYEFEAFWAVTDDGDDYLRVNLNGNPDRERIVELMKRGTVAVTDNGGVISLDQST